MSKSERWLHYDIPRDKQQWIQDFQRAGWGSCYCVATCGRDIRGRRYRRRMSPSQKDCITKHLLLFFERQMRAILRLTVAIHKRKKN